MAKLYFRYGAMGSSKTANAIMVQYNYQERGQNALMLKPRLDNRDGERVVGSRSGLSAPCRFVEELDGIALSQYDCIIVDEAQFLKKAQVQRLVSIVDDLNIPVICYGLRADFQGNLFEGSQWLLAWADSIEELKNLATAPDKRGMGYGANLLRHVIKLCSARGDALYVGTSPANVPFYKKFGFETAYTAVGFFTDNYDEPIIENGEVLTDMLYMKRRL